MPRVRLRLLGLVAIALAAMTAVWPLSAASEQTPAAAAGTAPAAARGQGPQTLPPGGFVFVQLSDPQFGFSNSDRDFIQDTANAEFAVATVNRLKPAFVIITGDLVNKPGDAAQIAEYRRIIAKVDPAVAVYSVAGNHDIENEPTPATLAAYRSAIGKDYYTFRSGSLLGIVLNSTMIVAPQNVEAEYAAQDLWLREELAKARSSGARHVVIFQHHPWFLEKADEPDQYFNVPVARRAPLLTLFREAGITTLVSGHLHRSVEATDAGLTSVVTGPVGRPLGGQSGLRIFVVSDAGLSSRYYGFGELPYAITAPAPGPGRE